MFKVISPCKINLFLYINGRRNDGYHELQTFFVILDKGDEMSFEPIAENRIELEGTFDCALENNLIYKAYKLIQKASGKEFGVKIQVDKIIPQGGGLGGGSSNAATTLLVLNKMFRLNIKQDELLELGRQLGADVPVFINGHCAFAEGVGEKLKNINIPDKWYLIVCPNEHISTAAIFKDQRLKRNTKKLEFEKIMSKPFSNDMQDVVVKKSIKVGHILTRLLKYGRARMSGSGASCFVEFSSRKKAQQALNELKLPHCVCFIAKSINTSTVHLALNELT